MKKGLLIDKKMIKNFSFIAIPVVLQSVITIGINMMDTIMLGSFGDSYLSATSLSNQFYSIFQTLCMGLGGGAAVITAQSWGKKDQRSIHKTITLMLRITIVLSLIFMAITKLFPSWIMRIYTTDEQVLIDCVRYYRYLCYTFFFQGISLTMTLVLRSVKISKVSLYASLSAFFFNIFFNYVFIFGEFGFPRMEIEGAAVGTLIARIVEFIVIVFYTLLIDKKINYKLKYLMMPCKDFINRYFNYGAPVILSDFLLTLGNNAVAIIMGHISTAFVAAYSVTSVLQQITSIAIRGTSSAASVLIGNEIGEGNIERAYEEGKTIICLTVVLGFFAATIIYLCKDLMISYYNISDEAKVIADSLMSAVALMIIFQNMGSVLTKGVLRGGGDTKFLLLGDVFFLWLASVPLGYMAGLVWKLSSFWIYCFLRIDHILKTCWCLKRFFSKKWIHIIE